ncbi:unnamed protein product [Angiostrongylus costaricensis]|uniref:Secreted protein n=1 Tax=Angiostrongylus costaricensis TaxID=334426 RepID=A0A0R3PMF3_ANGCS|nr:unnamed protein product [Angiostrongylus costaricensis]
MYSVSSSVAFTTYSIVAFFKTLLRMLLERGSKPECTSFLPATAFSTLGVDYLDRHCVISWRDDLIIWPPLRKSPGSVSSMLAGPGDGATCDSLSILPAADVIHRSLSPKRTALTLLAKATL